MADIIIVGDGPGGLSAALFLARADHNVRVYGTDGTAMHYALLNNYLGIEQVTGTDFQTIARAQVRAAGATIVTETVESIIATDAGFEVVTDASNDRADYLIMSEGRSAPLAESLGAVSGEDGVTVDVNGRSSVDRVYVIGRSARPSRSQAIISAGDGAAAALDILAVEAGSDVQDWDTPPKNEE